MSTLTLYRDDGPLARALGRLGAPLAPSALTATGAVVLFAALAARGAAASDGLIAGAVAVFVALGGAAANARLERDPFRWAVPPLLRAGEYGGLLWIGSAGDALPAAFALCCALAFRHYDLVYRLRHQGTTPPAWLGAIAGGWDGRLVGGWVLLVAGALPAGLYVLAAALGVLFVADAVASWRRFAHTTRTGGQVLYDEGEGEAE